MGLFNIESPLMQTLGKVADLMWLNILTLVCCIPIVTAGASFAAMHNICLKMARGEEYYVTKGFFRAFKECFKQATIAWLMLILVIALLIGDYLILQSVEFPFIVRVMITVVALIVLLTATFIFPTIARFTDTIWRTIKNAFMISILQFPKTILMIILNVLPIVLALFIPQVFPLVFLFGFSLPAVAGANLYKNFFKKLEDQIRAAHPKPEAEDDGMEDVEKIFSDKLLENTEEDSSN